MADVAVALRGLDPAVAEQVQVVFVTTDPATDTPAVLGEYLDRFDADLPVRFVGLTGDQEPIDQAQLSAGVPLAEEDGRTHSVAAAAVRRRRRGARGVRRRATPRATSPRDLRRVAGAA